MLHPSNIHCGTGRCEMTVKQRRQKKAGVVDRATFSCGRLALPAVITLRLLNHDDQQGRWMRTGLAFFFN